MEALKAEGVRAHLRDPRRGQPADLRRRPRRRPDPHPGAPRAGRRAHGRGICQGLGRVGVAFATSGPGATNLVTPIADAIMDSVPTVFITGQVRTDLIGTDGFQEADVNGITMPIVKHSLHGPGPALHPRLRPCGLPHRLDRAPGPGADRHPAGPLAGRHRLRADHRDAEPAGLQALDRGQHQADPDRGQGARQRQPARDLRRRRRHQRQRLGGASRPLPRRQLPGHLHRDGPRRLPAPITSSGSGCSACTAPAPPTTRWTTPT